MTKHLLIPSALLLAAGCTTENAELGDYGLGDINAQSMNEEGLPGPHGEALDALVEGIVDATSANKSQRTLAYRSYVLPGALPGGPLSDQCGISPAITDLKVLDADCAGMNYRWGWEIEVEDCDLGDETFDGTMLITYDELAEIPPFFPIDMVLLDAASAINSNSGGQSSLRYELRLESDDTSVNSCGQEQGPSGFRFAARDTHVFSFDDNVLERSQSSGVQHEILSDIPQAPATILNNGEGVYEITLEDGDRSRVGFRVMGTDSRQGDLWPYQGTIEAHVEHYGDVTLRFTAQSPVDGTVEVITPFTVELATLPMD
jgi:hypothetical protein